MSGAAPSRVSPEVGGQSEGSGAACRNDCIRRGVMIYHMSAIKGRSRRQSAGSATVPVQARVPVEIRELLNSATMASGISAGLYLESLVLSIVRTNGQLPVFERVTSDTEAVVIVPVT